MMGTSIYLFFTCLSIFVNCTNAVFNYQIGARVNDKISDFTYLIAQTLHAPLVSVTLNVVNFSEPALTCRDLFLAAKLTYPKEIANLFIGLENGLFIEYITLKTMPYGMEYGQSSFKGPGGSPLVSIYTVGRDGMPDVYQHNTSYNVRGRGWYVTAKSLRKNYWTAPYIDGASGSPVVSLIYPILNYTLNGQYYQFAGCVAADVYLSQISDYLVKSYQNTDQNVFIVDKASLSLLGNSLGAMTYLVNPSTLKKV